MDVEASASDVLSPEMENASDFAHALSLDKQDLTSTGRDKLRTDLLSRVALSDAHFKHQQRGEQDLTFDEKYQIASDVLSKNASTFLARFGQYISVYDVEYFSDMKTNYEIQFYLKDILKKQDTIQSQKIVKNRRYSAMQELMSQGDYFSDDEMKWREPLLYHDMVGQHLSDEEIQSKIDKTDLRFSNILLKHMDQIQENILYAQKKEAEECQEEESEEEDEEEEEDMVNGDAEMDDDDVDDDSEKKNKISDIEKQMLKSEFLQILQERFMSGKDKDFDYSKVDTNSYYDSLDTLNKDEEEKYFDGEVPSLVDSPMMDSPCSTGTPRKLHSPVAQSLLDGPRSVKQDEIQNYMTFDTDADSEVNATMSQLTKMAVSQESENQATENQATDAC